MDRGGASCEEHSPGLSYVLPGMCGGSEYNTLRFVALHSSISTATDKDPLGLV